MKQKQISLILNTIYAILCFALSTLSIAFAGQYSTGKTLILYYSLTGNTRLCCEAIKKELGADIIEIKDLKKRDTKGFAYFTTAIGSLMGMKTTIEPKNPDLTPYENIVLGSPIWTGKLSMAIRTLIDKNRFDGKKVVIFTTTNKLEKEKYIEKSKNLVKGAGGKVVGYFQVAVTREENNKKILKSKDAIVKEALQWLPDIVKAFSSNSGQS